MRLHTSFAFGLCAAMAAACSGSGRPEFSDEPFLSPDLPEPTEAAPAEGNVQQVEQADPEAASPESQTPVERDGSEAPPEMELVPAETGVDGDSSAAEPPAEPPPEETAGAEPAPPVEEQPIEEPPAVEEPPVGRTQVFILFGQSNMWGVPAPQDQDMTINPRVEVLSLENCQAHSPNQWVPAQPPLHGCVGRPGFGPNGPGVGPGDYFARTIAEAFPEDTILLVPNAIPGVSIDVFQPGQQAYNSMLARSRMAQERGEVRGIIFHQGETDCNQNTWPARVKNVVDRLRSDLGAGNVPFVAGELFRDRQCHPQHNQLVNQLPNTITNAFVASSNGFAPVPNDGFGDLHFDLNSQREFGRRYAQAMLPALR